MTIPFRVKLLTSTAKAPERANDGDLWDLFADDFSRENITYRASGLASKRIEEVDGVPVDGILLAPQDRILVKTGIAIELPKNWARRNDVHDCWVFENHESGFNLDDSKISEYAVADIRPRSGLALKHGITVLNTPGTIDNSYRKEIGVILINHGIESYLIKKGDKIAQMLIRTLAPSSFEIVKSLEDTGRGGYGSTGF